MFALQGNGSFYEQIGHSDYVWGIQLSVLGWMELIQNMGTYDDGGVQ